VLAAAACHCPGPARAHSLLSPAAAPLDCHCSTPPCSKFLQRNISLDRLLGELREEGGEGCEGDAPDGSCDVAGDQLGSCDSETAQACINSTFTQLLAPTSSPPGAALLAAAAKAAKADAQAVAAAPAKPARKRAATPAGSCEEETPDAEDEPGSSPSSSTQSEQCADNGSATEDDVGDQEMGYSKTVCAGCCCVWLAAAGAAQDVRLTAACHPLHVRRQQRTESMGVTADQRTCCAVLTAAGPAGGP
jgi:hypothetical protein